MSENYEIISNEELASNYEKYLMMINGWWYLTKRYMKRIEKIRNAQFIVAEGDNIKKLKFKKQDEEILQSIIKKGVERTVQINIDRQWDICRFSKLGFPLFIDPLETRFDY
jgi:hypothetical protein